MIPPADDGGAAGPARGSRSAKPFAPNGGPGDPTASGGDGGDRIEEHVEELIDAAMTGLESSRDADREVEATLEQTAESAVAEAVELAGRFEAERDEYLDMLKRLQAEFENYKRRVDTQRMEQRAQAAADLVRDLLPVLDACDAAVAAGHEDVEPVRSQLLGTLEKQGLSMVNEAGVPFDPHVHEAVLHEDGEGETVVAEVMRTGYLWNKRVVRAAMVKVRG